MSRLPLTVGILAKNEQEDLPACLEQCGFANEVVILVDTDSSDRTEAIARTSGATVIKRPLQSFAAARNTILQHASNDWVLFLDVDERMTSELTRSIQDFLRNPGVYLGAEILRQDVFLGRQLRHGDANGWFLRLGCTDAGRWERAVHEVWEINGPITRLTGVLQHFAHKSVAEYLRKMEFYTDLDAQDTSVTAYWWQLVIYPVLKFLKVYILQQGFLDGYPGLVFAILNARYSYTKRRKLLATRSHHAQ